jgi:hypothetical protein
MQVNWKNWYTLALIAALILYVAISDHLQKKEYNEICTNYRKLRFSGRVAHVGVLKEDQWELIVEDSFTNKKIRIMLLVSDYPKENGINTGNLVWKKADSQLLYFKGNWEGNESDVIYDKCPSLLEQIE